MRKVYLFKPLNNHNKENLHHFAGSLLFFTKLFYTPINPKYKWENKVIYSGKILFLLQDKIPLVYFIETLQPLTYDIPENFKGEKFIHGKPAGFWFRAIAL